MNFFTITQKKLNFGNISFKWPLVEPIGSGFIDVVRNFQWKNVITPNGVDEVPTITLTEYVLPFGKWMQTLSNLFNNLGSLANTKEVHDPYGQLYTGIPTKFIYNLPYLVKPGTTLTGDIKNDWKEVDTKNLPSKVASFIKRGEGLLATAGDAVTTGYGFEKVSSYSGTANRKVTITFPLYNTVDINKTRDNFWLVQLLGIQNLKIRTSYLTYIPPKIYSVDFKDAMGGVFMPAAYVSNYSVVSIGATRQVDIGITEGYPCLIPEAYKISITLSELVSNSANIMSGSLKDTNFSKLIDVDTTRNPAEVGEKIFAPIK